MSVYVDPLFATVPKPTWPFKKACHMFAHTLEELHAMADRIGLRRSWFQVPKRPGGLPHYDLTPGMRAKACAAGAVKLEVGTDLLAAMKECGWVHPAEVVA